MEAIVDANVLLAGFLKDATSRELLLDARLNLFAPEHLILEISHNLVKQYTQAALRDMVGNSKLDIVLAEREKIADGIKKLVDAETSGWGVDIESIKIQEIELPAEMKRAVAKQAEAERERRAVIIASEEELKASENLRMAAENLAKSPAAIQLRTLQTIRDIAAER